VRWAEAWVGKCAGCGEYAMLYEEVEFVCGRCHGTIDPGAAIPEAAGNALEALYEAQLPVREVLAALWEKGAS
jgi:hypothetical protein